MIALGVVRFFVSLLPGIGGLLFFFGFTDSLLPIVTLGIVAMSLSEAAGVYLVKYDPADRLQLLKANFWRELGTSWAFPVLAFILHLASGSRFLITLSLVFSVLAFFRSASLIIKVYMVDKNI